MKAPHWPPNVRLALPLRAQGRHSPAHLEPVHVGQAPRGGAQRAAGAHEAAAVPGAGRLRRLAEAGDGDRHHGPLGAVVRSQQTPGLLQQVMPGFANRRLGSMMHGTG